MIMLDGCLLCYSLAHFPCRSASPGQSKTDHRCLHYWRSSSIAFADTNNIFDGEVVDVLKIRFWHRALTCRKNTSSHSVPTVCQSARVLVLRTLQIMPVAPSMGFSLKQDDFTTFIFVALLEHKSACQGTFSSPICNSVR